MKIIFLIIIGFILTYGYSFAQRDSIPTIILHTIDPYYKDQINKIVLPHKSIKIKTNNGEIFRANQIYIVGDTALAFATDTIAFKNILFVSAKTKGYTGQAIAGAFMIIIGSLAVPSGLVYFFFQNNETITNGVAIEILGVGLMSSGIALVSKKHFKTQNRWAIITGYY